MTVLTGAPVRDASLERGRGASLERPNNPNDVVAHRSREFILNKDLKGGSIEKSSFEESLVRIVDSSEMREVVHLACRRLQADTQVA